MNSQVPSSECVECVLKIHGVVAVSCRWSDGGRRRLLELMDRGFARLYASGSQVPSSEFVATTLVGFRVSVSVFLNSTQTNRRKSKRCKYSYFPPVFHFTRKRPAGFPTIRDLTSRIIPSTSIEAPPEALQERPSSWRGLPRGRRRRPPSCWPSGPTRRDSV